MKQSSTLEKNLNLPTFWHAVIFANVCNSLANVCCAQQLHTAAAPPCCAARRAAALRAAAFHVGRTPVCSKVGLGVREISIAAGTGADVMAGGAGAAGPAPDVRHQPQGYPDLYSSN